MWFLSRLKQLFRPAPPPVGLGIALGSGGAKGMAHLGALKAFEEAGITFSFVAGTSIGAVRRGAACKGIFRGGYAPHRGGRQPQGVFQKPAPPLPTSPLPNSSLKTISKAILPPSPFPFAACATGREGQPPRRSEKGQARPCGHGVLGHPAPLQGRADGRARAL